MSICQTNVQRPRGKRPIIGGLDWKPGQIGNRVRTFFRNRCDPVVALTRFRLPTKPMTLFSLLEFAWPRSRRAVIASLALGLSLAIAVMAVITMPPIFERARQQAEQSACARQLAIIALAMQAYCDEYGSYPPAYLVDRDGRPAHSWRVLLLPYLEGSQVYAEYRFDEPWDSPHNRQLAGRLHKVAGCPMYSCPADTSTWNNAETNYVVITGKDTMFDATNSMGPLMIRDGTSSTLMIVEVTGTGIHWMEPRDLDIGTMDFLVGTPTGKNISSLHQRGAQVAFADSRPDCLNPDAREDDVRRLTSVAGDDPLSPSRMIIFER
jgi:hypothetical protein